MSDFRFAGRWINDRRVMTLSGDDFRAFVTAGAWMVENRTDGHVTPDDLEFIPRFDRSCVPRLIVSGLWAEDSSDGWVMVDYHASQTSRSEFETLDKARVYERTKKSRQRAHKAGDHRLCDSGNCADMSPGQSRDMSPGTTQARTGKARQGQDSGGTPENWHTAIPGDPDSWGDPSAPGSHLKVVS